MHTKSWFRVSDNSELLVFGKGGRQGCRYGGIIVNLSYVKALKRFYDVVARGKIPVILKYAPGAIAVDVTSTDCQFNSAIVLDVTFVDDEAFVVMASVPNTLIAKFKRAVVVLVEALEYYGMT